MKTIRVSSFPRLAICPGSAYSSGTDIEAVSPYAEQGTELAQMIDRHIKRLPLPRSTSDTVNRNFDRFIDMWQQMDIPDGTELRSEEPVSYTYNDKLLITGRPDLVIPEHNIIIDWKSGYGDWDYLPQLMGYAYAYIPAISPEPTPNETLVQKSVWKLVIINPAKVTVQVHEVTAEGIAIYVQNLLHRIVAWDRSSYTTGEHCVYCPNRYSCPALNQQLQVATAMVGYEGQAIYTPEDLVRIYPMIGLAEKRLDEIKKYIRSQVTASGGRLETEDGTLELVDIPKSEINVQQAASLLSEHIGQEKMFELLKISVTDVDNAFIEQFKSAELENLPEGLTRDKKGQIVKVTLDDAKRWLREQLRLAGGMLITHSQKLQYKARKEVSNG